MDGGFDEGGDINGGSWRVGTIDAELEAELCKYGNVKDLTIFAEKDNGKSKGYCQVEFHDPSAAMACQEGMNGHIFNGQPCVVAHATPISVRKKGAVQVRKKRELNQTSLAQPRSNAQGIGSGGITATPPLFHPQTMMGHGFGRGRIAATRPTLFHPQPMMGHGFRPAYRAHMGGPHRGFTAPSFSGFLPPSFPGVVPHVNPYFRGRGTPATGFVGHNFGMWTDPSAAGRGSDQEPIYGEEDASSKLQYGEGSHERGACSDASHRMGPDEKGPEIYLHVPMHLDDKEPETDIHIIRDSGTKNQIIMMSGTGEELQELRGSRLSQEEGQTSRRTRDDEDRKRRRLSPDHPS
ncbi:hypothetical protein HHK36_003404 [Tetracentron sinense]|uniref:RRM domain-containing protein n=1 Tax=Tetracentron sinense TaxID=13715 RepID=A0A835DSG7_TETSI|nr:hypothetical protein HHK36_003404 [Tetracentron sinense]